MLFFGERKEIKGREREEGFYRDVVVMVMVVGGIGAE